MKSFDEFRKTLTEDELARIADDAGQVLAKNRDELSDDPKTALGNQITTISLFMSLGLLEKYHEWLEEQA